MVYFLKIEIGQESQLFMFNYEQINIYFLLFPVYKMGLAPKSSSN